MNVTLLIYSNSKYIDVLSVLISTLERHIILDTFEKVKIVILGDYPIENFVNQLESSKFDYKFVEYVEEDGYSAHLLSATRFLDSYFLYLQDDFFLHEDIKVSELLSYFVLLAESSYSLFRLTPDGYRRSLAYLHSYTRSSMIEISRKKFFLVDFLSALPACMQATVWKTDTFTKMHDYAKIMDLREEWNPKYREFFKIEKIEGFTSETTIFPYISVTAVKRGRWNFLDSYYAEVLMEILARERVNPLDRGMAIVQKRNTVTKGSILKDIWRRVLYSL